MIKGALFDMDGVLVDNTPAHIEAFAAFCARYSVTDWEEKLSTAFGMGNEDILRLILPKEVIQSKGIQALANEKEAIYREQYAPRMHPVAGLRELLIRLRDVGVRCAVGSSGPIENIRMVIDGCGVAEYFDCIVSGDQVAHCKPDPEIYLTAAAGLGFSPSQCVVFEDAPAGIESARRAGVGRIIALATTCTRDVLEQEHGVDRIIGNFSEITDLNYLLR